MWVFWLALDLGVTTFPEMTSREEGENEKGPSSSSGAEAVEEEEDFNLSFQRRDHGPKETFSSFSFNAED